MLPTFSAINPIISFWTLGDIFVDTIFVTLDYSRSDCIENDLEDAKKDVLACFLAEIDLIYNLRLKRKILGSFKKYHEKSMDLFKKLSL